MHGVALSLPTVVGPDRATRVLEPELTLREREAVLQSGDLLESAWRELKSPRD